VNALLVIRLLEDTELFVFSPAWLIFGEIF
jgi:hypothetical protein